MVALFLTLPRHKVESLWTLVTKNQTNEVPVRSWIHKHRPWKLHILKMAFPCKRRQILSLSMTTLSLMWDTFLFATNKPKRAVLLGTNTVHDDSSNRIWCRLAKKSLPTVRKTKLRSHFTNPNIRQIWLSAKRAQPAKAGGGYRWSSQYTLKFRNRLLHGSNQSSGGQWQDGPENSYSKVTNFRTVLNFVLSYYWKKCKI